MGWIGRIMIALTVIYCLLTVIGTQERLSHMETEINYMSKGMTDTKEIAGLIDYRLEDVELEVHKMKQFFIQKTQSDPVNGGK
jgi:hypothetical protein